MVKFDGSLGGNDTDFFLKGLLAAVELAHNARHIAAARVSAHRQPVSLFQARIFGQQTPANRQHLCVSSFLEIQLGQLQSASR